RARLALDGVARREVAHDLLDRLVQGDGGEMGPVADVPARAQDRSSGRDLLDRQRLERVLDVDRLGYGSHGFILRTGGVGCRRASRSTWRARHPAPRASARRRRTRTWGCGGRAGRAPSAAPPAATPREPRTGGVVTGGSSRGPG